MATIYMTAQNEMTDAICWHVYGASSGYVERVLDVNPGLAEVGPVLPIGMRVLLPDLPKAAQERKIVSLWD